MNRQVLNYYIAVEINNKFLTKNLRLIYREQTLVCQFKFYDVKMIKNIIAQELIGFKRPKITAVILKKNISINLKNKGQTGLLRFLQSKPMIWSDKLYATSNVSDNFFKGVFTVKNNKLELLFNNIAVSKIDMMIKSAYFD